jgi:hypothetical protein
MAISTDDLRNYSFIRIAGSAGVTSLGVLYKLRNLASSSSTIATAINITGEDCYLSIIGSGNNPKLLLSGNVGAIAIMEKKSNNILARWEVADFADVPAVFANNTGTNGANYATWLAFTTALNDFITKTNS